MTGDMGEFWNDVKACRKQERDEHGQPCPDCTIKLPKAQPKILMPGQKCWCGYRDKRERLSHDR